MRSLYLPLILIGVALTNMRVVLCKLFWILSVVVAVVDIGLMNPVRVA